MEQKIKKKIKKKNSLILISAIILLSLVVPAAREEARARTKKINFVIIFPGGPSAGSQGRKIIKQFIDKLTAITGMPKSSLKGVYFNKISKAKRYVKRNKDSYIMGSLGFFLSMKNKLNLVPLATVQMKNARKEQYRIMVRKGKYSSLAALKGKKLTGHVLFEDKKFINSVIFNGTINVSSYFKLKPTSRLLSAIRKVARNRMDAVIINQMQYDSLKPLSVFKKLSVVYSSEELPPLGLMMIQTSKTASVKNKVVNAITTMCSGSDGKQVCRNFGIDGFIKISPGALNNVIKKYNRR